MHVFIALLAGIAAVSAVPASPQRIAGGSVTTIDQYPSVAALLHSWNGNLFVQSCGGTILNNRAILTAAHCAYGDSAPSWRFRVGSSWANSGGNVHACQSIITFSGYNPVTLQSDIAILRSTSVISFSNVIQPASFAGSNYVIPENDVFWTVGWGAISPGGPHSEQLRHVQTRMVNPNICRDRYAAIGLPINGVCTGWLDVGGRGPCHGDSGGPVFHHRVVVGVYSFSRSCGDPYYPDVNVRVSSFISWIFSNA